MRSMLPGISGTLFPSRYLVDHVLADAARVHVPDERTLTANAAHIRLRKWWSRVEARCGPATGVRSLFDEVAMPLAATLGFKAVRASFHERAARVELDPPVAMLVVPWAERSPSLWRASVDHARACHARWSIIVAPPYVQIVDTSAGWAKRSVEFRLPDVLRHDASFSRFWCVSRAWAFSPPGPEPAPLSTLVALGAAFQDRVRDDLQTGVAASLTTLARVLPTRDESLAVIYRLLFLLFVESRDLVPWRHPLYRPAYSIAGMAEALGKESRSLFPGLWAGLAAISRLLRTGCRIDDLDVRPFNGHLFARSSAPTLEAESARTRRGPIADRRDAAIRDTLTAITWRKTRAGREPITYPDLGVEQLGAVYEHILDAPHRKASGTFYTPRALTEFVVRRTLAPLTRSATSDALLSLRIVDPAMGSGAFLVAACRYVAAAYERALVEEGRIAESDVTDELRGEFRRLVAQRCLYGVDRNHTAVQLARLSLWLATLSSGKPLTFLDHRLRVGDALVGARPQDLRHITAGTRASTSPLPLFDDALESDLGRAAAPLAAMARQPDDTLDDVRRKEAQWSHLSSDTSSLHRWRMAAHLWCARWFPERGRALSLPELRAAVDALLRGDRTLPTGALTGWLRAGAAQAGRHHFFHWPLEFADAFYDADGRARDDAGFDAVIGNPPWEMLRADHNQEGDAARLVRFIRECGLYPSCGRGHVNLYQPFVERALDLSRHGGRVGLIVPWGIASDEGTKALRIRLLDRCRTDTIVGVDNSNAIFPVHRGLRFAVVIASPGGRTTELRLHAGVKTTAEIEALPDSADEPSLAPLELSRGLLANAGGASRRFPDVRNGHDLQLLDELTSRFPPLGSAAGWAVEFGRELNATEDRGSFTAVTGPGLPVIEGKQIHPFLVELASSRFRISPGAARKLLPDLRFERPRLAYRDVSAVSNRTSLIAAIIPAGAVTTHTLFCLKTPLDLDRQHFLAACFNSYVLNAIVRMLMGGHLTTSLVESLPVPLWTGNRAQRRIARLASRLARGRPQGPIRARIESEVARIYGIENEQLVQILRGFPLVTVEEKEAILLETY